jgi:hypothetical protein
VPGARQPLGRVLQQVLPISCRRRADSSSRPYSGRCRTATELPCWRDERVSVRGVCFAYKPEHAVDLDTGISVAAALHPADQGDTTTIEGTLTAAEKNLAQLSAAPTTDQPSQFSADKGYHSRALLKRLDGGVWKTRIAEPKQPGFSRWHGDAKARVAAMQTAPVWVQESAGKRCGGGQKSSSGRSPTILTEAGCGGPGCADAKMFTNDIWSTSPATISAS